MHAARRTHINARRSGIGQGTASGRLDGALILALLLFGKRNAQNQLPAVAILKTGIGQIGSDSCE